MDHIEHESLQVRTYINGTLYSLLTMPALKEQARAYGLSDMIAHLLATTDEQIARQLRYILDQLSNDQVEECESDDNEDALDMEDNESNDTENDEEIDEEILNAGVQTGDQLLQEYSEQPALDSSIITDRSYLPTPVKTSHINSSSSTSICFIFIVV